MSGLRTEAGAKQVSLASGSLPCGGAGVSDLSLGFACLGSLLGKLHSLPPYLPPSLICSLPPFLPSSLPPSLSPSLSLSLCFCLFLCLCLSLSLSLSLSPSLSLSLSPSLSLSLWLSLSLSRQGHYKVWLCAIWIPFPRVQSHCRKYSGLLHGKVQFRLVEGLFTSAFGPPDKNDAHDYKTGAEASAGLHKPQQAFVGKSGLRGIGWQGSGVHRPYFQGLIGEILNLKLAWLPYVVRLNIDELFIPRRLENRGCVEATNIYPGQTNS